MNDKKYPPAWRMALGFLIAPPLLWLALTWGSPLPGMLDPEWASADVRERFSFTLFFATYIGYPSVLLFGLPIFVLLEWRRDNRAYDNVLLAGAGAAMLPLIIWMVPAVSRGQGLLFFLVMLVATGLYGATAGFAFWLAAFEGWRDGYPDGDAYDGDDYDDMSAEARKEIPDQVRDDDNQRDSPA